jgi:hypothetical protein
MRLKLKIILDILYLCPNLNLLLSKDIQIPAACKFNLSHFIKSPAIKLTAPATTVKIQTLSNVLTIAIIAFSLTTSPLPFSTAL